MAELLARWDTRVFDPGLSPEVLDGIFKGLMMIHLHRDVVGKDIYPQVASAIGDIFTAGLKAMSEERTRD